MRPCPRGAARPAAGDLAVGPDGEVRLADSLANPRDVAFCCRARANAQQVKAVRYTDHPQVAIDLLTYWVARAVLPETGGARS